jgi:hypothetical protein
MTLRNLLIQRSARLQEYPALTAPPWGELRYPAFRNRVEGVALGLVTLGLDRCHCATGLPWDWVCEMACASCGLLWDPAGPAVGPEVLGGVRFNLDEGRQAYHDRDHDVLETTPFTAGLTHGELLARLRRLNGRLGWDHATTVPLPLEGLGSPEVRAALWSALYGGSHAILAPGIAWDPTPFKAFWSE